MLGVDALFLRDYLPATVGIAMSQQTDPPSDVYRVCVRTILDEGWVRALQITPIATHRHYSGIPRTILTLQLTDQSEMLGLLNRLHNMGLTIMSVEMGEPNPA
jgi:hypothetical protein